jgi:hydrogenase maturation protease
MIEAKLSTDRSPWIPKGSDNPSILVVGLGNPILGDDGVGWRVADEVARLLALKPLSPPSRFAGKNTKEFIEIEHLSLGGLSLMERLIGYDQAVIIDAIQTGNHPLGTVRRFSLAELPNLSEGHTTSAHDTSLQTAILLGRSLGVKLPEEIVIVSIEAEITYEFSEELSPAISAAVSEATACVLDQIERWI